MIPAVPQRERVRPASGNLTPLAGPRSPEFRYCVPCNRRDAAHLDGRCLMADRHSTAAMTSPPPSAPGGDVIGTAGGSALEDTGNTPAVHHQKGEP